MSAEGMEAAAGSSGSCCSGLEASMGANWSSPPEVLGEVPGEEGGEPEGGDSGAGSLRRGLGIPGGAGGCWCCCRRWKGSEEVACTCGVVGIGGGR
jgi:hypothetical protein